MPRPKSNLHRYNIYLDKSEQQEYRDIAQQRGMSLAELQRAVLSRALVSLRKVPQK